MTIEHRLALALLWLATAASAAEDAKPGGKRICVPSEDGRSWVCGTPDAPPPERGLPAVRDDVPSPEPPPFLAAPGGGTPSAPAADLSESPPERAPPDRFEGSGREAPNTADAATVAPAVEESASTPEPLAEEPPATVTEAPAPETSPALDVVGADSAEAGTPRLLAAPRAAPAFPLDPEPSPAPAEPEPPEPVVDEPVVDEPVVVEPMVDEPVVDEPVASESTAVEPTATAPAAPDPAPVVAQALASPPGNSAAFLAQPATHYTLQIARAAMQSGFSAQLGALGLRGEEAWAVPLAGGGATSWLLLWGVFPDLESARAAAAGLAPRVAAWPRRIAPIQDELRAAGTR